MSGRRLARWGLVGWLLLVPARSGWAADPGLMIGERKLAMGQWRLAAQAFREVLRDHPRSPRARIGLARALAQFSQCDEALAILGELKGRRAWTGGAAAAEGHCHLRRGDVDRAVEAFSEAASLEPDVSIHWVQLAQAAAWAQDVDRTEEALLQLSLCRVGAELELVVRAGIALMDGDPALDGWIDRARAVVGPSPGLGIYDARRWMDLGDPFTAERLLLWQMRQSMTNAQVAFWRAEALRRMGATAAAEAVYRRRVFQARQGDGLALALRARILVDLGELDAASALLEGHPGAHEEEAIASRWYLARAQRDEARMTRLARAWDQVVQARDRHLDQLVPIAPPDSVGASPLGEDAP